MHVEVAARRTRHLGPTEIGAPRGDGVTPRDPVARE